MSAAVAIASETFACRPYDVRLTRGSCGRRWEHANGRAEPQRGQGAITNAEFKFRFCHGCPIGEAHARGEVHPDAPVIRLSIVRSEPAPPVAAEELVARSHRLVEEATAALEEPASPPELDPEDPVEADRLDDQGQEEEDEMARAAKQITHAGVTDTTAGWAERCGLTVSGMRSKLARMPVAEALAGARLHDGFAKVPLSKKPANGKAKKNGAAAAASDEYAAQDPAGLLQRLGYDVEDLGEQPAGGRLLLVRGGDES